MNLGLSAEQLAERRKGIGASDAAAIIEGKWYDLWLDKTGQREPKKIMSDWQAAWRYATEALQLDWYEHIHGGKVSRRGDVVVSADRPFMRCTLDGWVDDLGVPINAKHLSKWTKEARAWAIEHYTPQVTHEALVCCADYGLISLLHGEKEPEIIKIEVDPLFAARLVVREAEFWGYVERREPPPDAPPEPVPDVATTVAKLEQVHVPTALSGPVYEALVRENNWLPDLLAAARRFRDTDGAAKVHAIAGREIKDLLPPTVGLVEWGLFKVMRDKGGAVRPSVKKVEE